MNPGIVKQIVKCARREHHAYIRARKHRNALPFTEEGIVWDQFAWHAKWSAFDHMCHAWLVSGRRPMRDKIRLRKIRADIAAEEEMRRAA